MYNIAVIGASGHVGQTMIRLLEERNFPVNKAYFLASERSTGQQIPFQGKNITIQNLETFNFEDKDIKFAFSSPGGGVSAKHSPRAAQAGVIVIDNTSHFRMHDDISLIVPEVNFDDYKKYPNKNIIANPNCSTIQMVLALKPLHELYKIKRVVVSTYQAVSGGGKACMDELFHNTKAIFENNKQDPKNFTKPIEFNAIPHIDKFMEDDNTKEEWKMKVETKKILDPNIEVSATCVRVPTFTSHGESINIEFENDFDINQVIEALEKQEGVKVYSKSENGGYVTPKDAAGRDSVFVSRIRRDDSRANSLNMWVVSDNVRKGAALNTIQIAEKIIEEEGK